jgi:hypothetical protein
MKNSRWLVGAVLLQAGMIAGMTLSSWTRSPLESQAVGQIIPDPAAQQMKSNEILSSVDGKLDKLIAVLEGGELKVKVVGLPAAGR